MGMVVWLLMRLCSNLILEFVFFFKAYKIHVNT